MIPLYKSIERSEGRAVSRQSLDSGPQEPLSIVVTRVAEPDVQSISQWLTARGLPPLDLKVLPSTGVWVKDVAAGFLYLTNSRIALIEGYTSNPGMSAEIRNAGLQAVTEYLLDMAKSSGRTHILIFTDNKEIVDRAHSWGFRGASTKRLMVKELE